VPGDALVSYFRVIADDVALKTLWAWGAAMSSAAGFAGPDNRRKVT
jgi:hypothetical protein